MMTKAGEVEWRWRAFGDLTCDELYDLMGLRQAAFILEQQCLYQDADGRDRDAWHLLGVNDGKIVAYLRVCPSPAVSIGRVVVDESVRRQGVGKALMQEGVRWVRDKYDASQDIAVSAQAHLVDFYKVHGFKQHGTQYMEDGIEHVKMVLPAGVAAGPQS